MHCEPASQSRVGKSSTFLIFLKFLPIVFLFSHQFFPNFRTHFGPPGRWLAHREGPGYATVYGGLMNIKSHRKHFRLTPFQISSKLQYPRASFWYECHGQPERKLSMHENSFFNGKICEFFQHSPYKGQHIEVPFFIIARPLITL